MTSEIKTTTQNPSLPVEKRLPQPRGIKPRPALTAAERDGFTLRQDTEKAPPFQINTLLLTLILTVTFALQGFMVIPLPDLFSAGFNVSETTQYQPLFYTTQLPFALFIGALLGPLPGVMAMLIYITVGLFFFPLFTHGGGLHYLSEPGFGYFVGMAAATILCGKLIRWVFQSDHRPVTSGFRLLIVTLASVLSVHLLGILWTLGLTLFQVLPFNEATHWLTQQSFAPLVYDVVITLALLALVRPIRYLLWLVIY